jgi:hypothetical protein
MNDDPIADQAVGDRAIRSKGAVASDASLGSDRHARADSGLGAQSVHRAGIDAALEARTRMDESAHRNPHRLEHG